MAQEHAERSSSRPRTHRKAAWVDTATDGSDGGAPRRVERRKLGALPGTAGGLPLDLVQRAAGVLHRALGRGRNPDGAAVDIDAVSLRRMPNSTGRAVLAEGRGARVRITRCGERALGG